MLIKPEAVIQALHETNMSPKELAVIIGVSHCNMCSYLQGSRRVSTAFKNKLKEVFPYLAKQIDDHKVFLSCPKCGFGVTYNNRKKRVCCTRCYIAGPYGMGVSEWNDNVLLYKQNKPNKLIEG